MISVWLFLDRHNVNFCQRFSYPGIYARRTGDLVLAAESEYWLQQHWLTWGQMPRCAFAADENTRAHCTDSRYGLESCSWGEYVRSFQHLANVDGEPRWADHTEDVIFNHAPCAYTPDCKMVHYITTCNQVNIDARTDHDYQNGPPMNACSEKPQNSPSQPHGRVVKGIKRANSRLVNFQLTFSFPFSAGK